MTLQPALVNEAAILDGPTVARAVGTIIRAADSRPEEAAPRRRLCSSPSAIRRLHRLEKEIGTSVELYVKRDESLRPLFGNKLRYIEYVLGAYDLLGADCIIHCGGLCSNYLMQLALVGAECKIPMHLIYAAPRPDVLQGNPLLAALFGADIRYRTGSNSRLKAELAEEIAREGRRPLVIDAPFTNHSAILGYMRAWSELKMQVAQNEAAMPDHIMMCSAGNSYLGMRIGADLDGADIGVIAISPIRFADAGLSELAPDRKAFLRKKIDEFSSFIGKPISVRSIDVDESFVGPDYGIPSLEGIAAARLLARTEGLLLDPIYSGKAMAGLLAYVRSGEFSAGTRVMFIHSGGLGNVFTFHDAFGEPPDRD